MPKKSQKQIQDERDEADMMAAARRVIQNPTSAPSAIARALGAMNAIKDRQERQAAERKAAAAERKRQRGREARDAWARYNVLPDNGRFDPNWKPTGPVVHWEPPPGLNRG